MRKYTTISYSRNVPWAKVITPLLESVVTAVTRWLLENGVWSDIGYWLDTSTWNDS